MQDYVLLYPSTALPSTALPPSPSKGVNDINRFTGEFGTESSAQLMLLRCPLPLPTLLPLAGDGTALSPFLSANDPAGDMLNPANGSSLNPGELGAVEVKSQDPSRSWRVVEAVRRRCWRTSSGGRPWRIVWARWEGFLACLKKAWCINFSALGLRGTEVSVSRERRGEDVPLLRVFA